MPITYSIILWSSCQRANAEWWVNGGRHWQLLAFLSCYTFYTVGMGPMTAQCRTQSFTRHCIILRCLVSQLQVMLPRITFGSAQKSFEWLHALRIRWVSPQIHCIDWEAQSADTWDGLLISLCKGRERTYYGVLQITFEEFLLSLHIWLSLSLSLIWHLNRLICLF